MLRLLRGIFFFRCIFGVKGQSDATKEAFIGFSDHFGHPLTTGAYDFCRTVGKGAGQNVDGRAQNKHEHTQSEKEEQARPPQQADVHQSDAEKDEQHGDGAKLVQFTGKKHPNRPFRHQYITVVSGAPFQMVGRWSVLVTVSHQEILAQF